MFTVKMPFRLHIVRHAEGTHNPHHDTTIHDPELTPTGTQQSADLSQDFPYKESVGLVLTSPLRRTLQTTLLGLCTVLDKKYYTDSGVSHGAKLILEPDVQAHSARPCDTGSEWSVLKTEFPALPWDEFQLDAVFPQKVGRYAPEWEVLEERGRALQKKMEGFFKEMQGSDDGRVDVVVVTHGGFMKFVTGDSKIMVGPGKWGSFLVEFDESSKLVVLESLTPRGDSKV